MIIQLEWRGEAENEKGIVSAIQKEKLKIKKEKLLAENQSTNLPAAAKAEEGQPINQSDASTLSNLEFVISPERCPWHNLELRKTVVSVDPYYYRLTEVDLLMGDATRAKNELGWVAKTKFDKLAKLMVREDYAKVQKRGY